MLIFPILYTLSFVFSLIALSKKEPSGILIYIIFGLPIYTTSLTICFISGYKNIIPFLQSFKEIIVILTLIIVLYNFKRKIKLLLLDKLIIGFIIFSLLYLLLPLGSYSFNEKILAEKSLVFFYLLYFTGRFFDLKKIYLTKYFYYIFLVSLLSTSVLLFEIINNTHLQTKTGYALFNEYYYGSKPEGSYGLSWTFERTNGLKRFASFFSNPLEYAASTLIVLPLMFGLYTTHKNKIRINKLGLMVLAATIITIIFSVSRASFISYLIIIYTYAIITKKKLLLHIIHAALLLFAFYLIVQINNKGIAQFIIDSINLKDSSTVAHITEWIDGINALITHPMGMGLGESGRVANAMGANIGGENQFIIIGVQIGIVGLFMNLLIYAVAISTPYSWIFKLQGRERKLCIAVLLMKISFFIPLMTSYFESYTYISYISWFFTGLLINMIDRKIQTKKSIMHAAKN